MGLICAAFLVLSVGREWSDRSDEVGKAEVDVANLAQSLEQQAEDTFELLDIMLMGIVNRLELDGSSPTAVSRLQTFMNLRKGNLGRIRSLFAFDEHGDLISTTADVEIKGHNNADRGYFHHHRQSDDRTMWIGRPVRSRSNGEWIITASRRFNRPDGSFGGVVLATIDVAYFTQFFSKFDLGKNGAATLFSADGIVLARKPDDGTYVGRDLSAGPLFKGRKNPAPAGISYATSPLDGLERLSFYRTSRSYPVVVLATKATNEVLANWRRDAAVRMAVVTSLLLAIAIVGFHLVKQLRARQGIEAELAAKEADFRLLAEESSDMVTRIGLDEHIQYASPSSLRVVGWRPDQLIGTPALAGVNPEDLPEVEQLVAALKRGEAQEARVVYRTRHRTRNEVWIESTMRVTRDVRTEAVNGVVAISRDMTEHKRLEQELASLATQDGLTGIANRRCFDGRLEIEWARARRDGSSLSLLMIDVDRFKKFNDRYGHQAGDVCLKSVAEVLARHARRPGDLAARYGGEEFVLLLPNTDPEGCSDVAEKIRASLAGLGIAHGGNPPSGKVTVSLGGATRSRCMDGSAALIETADLALYSAKQTGRDKFVMSAPVGEMSRTV